MPAAVEQGGWQQDGRSNRFSLRIGMPGHEAMSTWSTWSADLLAFISPRHSTVALGTHVQRSMKALNMTITRHSATAHAAHHDLLGVLLDHRNSDIRGTPMRVVRNARAV